MPLAGFRHYGRGDPSSTGNTQTDRSGTRGMWAEARQRASASGLLMASEKRNALFPQRA